jgi:hypothetical protein
MNTLKQNFLKLSNSNNLNEAVKEYILVSEKKHATKQDICLCGHKLKNSYWYFNKYNGNALILGSGCKKLFPHNLSNKKTTYKNHFLKQCKNIKVIIDDIHKYSEDVLIKYLDSMSKYEIINSRILFILENSKHEHLITIYSPEPEPEPKLEPEPKPDQTKTLIKGNSIFCDCNKQILAVRTDTDNLFCISCSRFEKMT